MKIELKQLSLKNFKGIKDLSINFTQETNIYGPNGSGKTTIFDAFTWLLFNKDSSYRSQFNIQTLDSENNIIHNLEHNVTAILVVDGVEKEISKTLTEKWTKTRGAAEKELKGTTTTYEVDGIPYKLKYYQKFISEIVNEDLFKILTNPLYFPSMDWKEQRKVVLEIIGDLSPESICSYNSELQPILSDIQEYGIDNLLLKTKNSISKLREQIKSIPARIDECNNQIQELNFDGLENKIKAKVIEIEKIDEQITDKSKANDKKLELQSELFKLKQEKEDIIFKAKSDVRKPLNDIVSNILDKSNEINKVKMHINSCKNDVESINKNIESTKLLITQREEEISNLKSKFLEEKSKCFEFDEFEFDYSLTYCHSCGREYDPDKIEEIKASALEKYNKSKEENKQKFINSVNNTLNNINKEGKQKTESLNKLKESLEKYKQQLGELVIDIENNEITLNSLNEELSKLEEEKSNIEKSINSGTFTVDTTDIDNRIESLNVKISEFNSANTSSLKQEKKNIENEISEIKAVLYHKEYNNKMKARISELSQEEKDANVTIAKLEGTVYLCEQYIKTKVELLEGRINNMFNGAVSFKLFKQLKNGGVEDCCELTQNGVPFSDLNSAAKIQVGLNLINILNDFYNTSIVTFIDNRESVIDIPETNNQIVNLIVSAIPGLKIK